MLRSVDILFDLYPAEVVVLEPTECFFLIDQVGWLLTRPDALIGQQKLKVFPRFLARISLGVIWAKLSCLGFMPPVMSRSIALTTSSPKLRDSSSLGHESVPPMSKVEFSVNQEQNTAPAARCSVSASGLSVKNTECWDVVRLQLGWFINQACPNDVE